MIHYIYFIYSDGCKDCAKIKIELINILSSIPTGNYNLKMINSTSDEAVDYAIRFGTDEIPFLIVDNELFTVENFDPEYISGLLAD